MDYVSIRVSTLRGNQKIDFNAYIQINDKMILFLRKGDSFEGSRLERLKDKKLRKMYILTEEEPQYRLYLQKNIEHAFGNKNEDIKTRAEIIQGAQQSQAEEVFENPQSQAVYNTAKEVAGRYSDFLLSNAQAASAILNIENTDRSISHHGVTVATLALTLAQRLGHTNEKKNQLLSLGGLLHDYGHHGSNLNIARSLSEFSKEELEIWKQHPKLGSSKVQDKRHFDQLVLNIIAQHEETINGMGPLGLKEKDMDSLTVIVASANALDRLVSFEGIPRNEAPKHLMIQHVGKHPLKHIQILAEITKL